MSEKSEFLRIKSGASRNCIVCFGGNVCKFGGVEPPKFCNYLERIYGKTYDIIFYVDRCHWWYQKGIKNISSNIPDTITYIQNKIKQYDNVIFMGYSAGGYASILFGSLINVKSVISFVPQTDLTKVPHNNIKEFSDPNYRDLILHINDTTKYFLYGNPNNSSGIHSIWHIDRLKDYPNVKIFKPHKLTIIDLMENGNLKNFIDRALI